MFTCSIDGVFREPRNATISVMDHGLLYGDGIFEGLRFYASKVFRLQAHLQRLKASARAIGLVLPMGVDVIAGNLQRAIDNSGLQDGYIRLVVTRGIGALGLDSEGCTEPRTIIIVDELTMVDPLLRQSGIKLMVSSIRQLNTAQLDPRIKSLNYLAHILARQEATAAGADEAILLNHAGRIAEGTADNVFLVKDGVLATPTISEGALDGITRAVIIELAAELSIPCEETRLGSYDLFNADECFLTGTGAELIPVASISGRCLGPERPIMRRLETAFREVVRPRPGQSGMIV